MPVGRTGRWPPTGWPSWMTGYVPTEIAAIRERRRTWSRRVCSSHFARAGSKLRKSWSGKCRRLNGGFRVALAACPKVSSRSWTSFEHWRTKRQCHHRTRVSSSRFSRVRGYPQFGSVRHPAAEPMRTDPSRVWNATAPITNFQEARLRKSTHASRRSTNRSRSLGGSNRPPRGRRAIPCRSSAGPFRRCRIATRASSIDNSSDPKAEES